MFNCKHGATDPPMSVAQFHEALDEISGERARSENLRHFLEAAYCSVARVTAPDATRSEALHARYMTVVRAYESNRKIMTRMSQLLSRLILAVVQYRGDFLGEAYATSGLANDRRQQFLSTYGIAEVTVRELLPQPDVSARLSKGQPITLLDPTCGTGTMVIAAAAHLESMGFDPRRALFATLVDVDPLAYQMAFLQMTFKGIPAVCICANMLTEQELDRACTAAAVHQRQRLDARAAPSDGAVPNADEPAAQPKHEGASGTPSSRSKRPRPH